LRVLIQILDGKADVYRCPQRGRKIMGKKGGEE